MNNEAEHNQMREDQEGSRGLHNCELLVCLVLVFGMDHIKNFKVKEIMVLLCCHLRVRKVEGQEYVTEGIGRILFMGRGFVCLL